MSPHIFSPTSVSLGMDGLILGIEPSTLTDQGDSCLALSAKFRLGDSPASCGAGGVPACFGSPDGSKWNEAVKPALAGRRSCELKNVALYARRGSTGELCARSYSMLTTMGALGRSCLIVLAVKSPLADHHGAYAHLSSPLGSLTCKHPFVKKRRSLWYLFP